MKHQNVLIAVLNIALLFICENAVAAIGVSQATAFHYDVAEVQFSVSGPRILIMCTVKEPRQC